MAENPFQLAKKDEPSHQLYHAILMGGLSAVFLLLAHYSPHVQGMIHGKSLALSFIPFLLLSFFWAAPLAAAFLGMGLRLGMLACLVTLGISAVGIGVQSILPIFLMEILPLIALCSCLLRGTDTWLPSKAIPMGIAFSHFSIFMLVGMTTLMVASPTHTALFDQAKEFLEQFDSVNSSLNPSQLREVLPGLFAISVMVKTILTTFLAYQIFDRFFSVRRRFIPHYDLTFSTRWDIFFALSLMLLLTENEIFAFIGKNMLVVTCLPLYCLGLSIIDKFLRQFTDSRLVLVVIILLSLFLGVIGLIFIILGVFEPLLALEKRLTNK